MENKFYQVYLIGIFIILFLPFLAGPSYFTPVDWGKGIIFRVVLSILLFLFIWQFFYKRNELHLSALKNNKIFWVLGIYFLLIILSTVFSQDINFSLWGSPYRGQGAINFLFYIIFAVFTFLIVKPEDWKKLLDLSIFIGVLVSLIAFIQYYGILSTVFVSSEDRPPSTMGNPIMLGIYILLLFFITFVFAIKEKDKVHKILYLSAVLLFFFTILITGSRAAYIGLFAGATYFLLLYPIKNTPENKLIFKKIAVLKIIFGFLIILGIFAVYYINSQQIFPQFLEDNKIFNSVKNRLSIDSALADPRFSAWKIAIKAIIEKPILGWGPENFAIGFDKYYNPSLPYISKMWGGWWDRAHNTLLDIAATTGIPALIAYLSIFIILIWQLQKAKNKKTSEQIVIHGIQTTLIGYFVANFFSFDGFSSYLLFYLIIGYSLYLIYRRENNAEDDAEKQTIFKKIKGRGFIISILSIFLIIFLWQYNFLPLQINKEINKADNLAENKKCEESFSVSESLLKKHSFLDAYIAIHYIDNIKLCAAINPDKNSEYAQKGAEILKNAVKIRPTYSRFWIFLGGFTTIKAASENDSAQKDLLVKESESYLKKAEQITPLHQEVIIEQAKLSMVSKNYEEMAKKAQKCIELEPDLIECYWTKIMSEIYLKKIDQANINFHAFIEKYGNVGITYLYQLANAFAEINDYPDLVIVYKEIIRRSPDVAQNYASLAFVYYKIGEYSEAKKLALKFLELMPEAKDEVNAFLKTLPY
jgi:putative inorganic carbon (HCO3(-)) transporter